MALARPALATAALVAVVAAAALAPTEPTAHEIVGRARAAHGVTVLDEACIVFRFRDATYAAARHDGRFAYRMVQGDHREAGLAALANDGLWVDTVAYEAFRKNRTPNAAFRDSVQANAASIVRAAETQLNSVVYFALLPYNLADPAVRLKRLDDAAFDGRTHRAVEVTFGQDGGGRDHDDRFVYWFDADTGLLRALAYRFHTGDGGTRFRRVSNVHRVPVSGRAATHVLLNDYAAYTDTTLGDRIEAYPQRLGAATMQRLPDIATEQPHAIAGGMQAAEPFCGVE